MKTSIFVLLSGAFLVTVVQTQNYRITDRWGKLCPVNEIPVLCQPCESFCNEEPIYCIDVCIGGSFCRCVNGYSRISRDIRICIPNELCYLFAKKNCTTTDTTTTTNPTAETPVEILN